MSSSLPEFGKLHLDGVEQDLSSLGPGVHTLDEIAARLTYAKPEHPVAKETGAYRAWRLWRLPEYALDLKALTRTDVWVPGENWIGPDPMNFGMKHGSAGFYGLLDIKEIAKQEPELYMAAKRGIEGWRELRVVRSARGGWVPCFYLSGWVVGSTLNYGRVHLAEKGLRSEKAVPECLVLSEDDDQNLRLLSLADKYKMKVVTLEEAKEMPTGLVEYSRGNDA